jgi:hypothetical protein
MEAGPLEALTLGLPLCSIWESIIGNEVFDSGTGYRRVEKGK